MKYSKNHTAYFNSSGKEVPSATTILKILNKPTIVNWANSLGFRHLKYESVLNEYAIIGTCVHAIINSILSNVMYIYVETPDVPSKEFLAPYIRSFMNWYKNNEIEPILLEKSFTTDTFGGTLDFYGKVNGKHSIIDFKTSKKIRMSMFIQLALYTILLEKKGYVVEQVGIVLCHPQHKDTKYMSREKLNPYIALAETLVKLFHAYYDLNESEWSDTIL